MPKKINIGRFICGKEKTLKRPLKESWHGNLRCPDPPKKLNPVWGVGKFKTEDSNNQEGPKTLKNELPTLQQRSLQKERHQSRQTALAMFRLRQDIHRQPRQTRTETHL